MELTAGPSHLDHAACWLVQAEDPAVAATCVACLSELLEGDTVPLVKKKATVERLLRMLRSDWVQLAAVLSPDLRVANHLALLLLELTMAADTSLAAQATEGVVGLTTQLKNDDMVSCVLAAISQEVLERCEHKSCLPLLTVLGHLLSVLPTAATQIITSHGPLVNFAVEGLSHADEAVQVAVTYLCVQLYSHSGATSHQMALHTHRQVVRGLLHVLHSARSYQLQLNSLGLLKTILEIPQLATLCTQEAPDEERPLASAVKKMLLQRREPLQIGMVQCVVVLLQGAPQYATVLLQADIPEFLFEALNTSNELLIESVFCCLVMFTETDAFFNKCHAVYGMDSILRGLENIQHRNNTEAQFHGLTLVARILARHGERGQLFSQQSSIKQCLTLVTRSASTSRRPLVIQAAKALTNMMSCQHISAEGQVPFPELAECLHSLVLQLERVVNPRQHCSPPASMGKHRAGHKGAVASAPPRKVGGVGVMLTLLLEAARMLERCPASDGKPTVVTPSSSASQSQSSDGTAAGSGGREMFTQCLLQLTEQTCLPILLKRTSGLELMTPQHATSLCNLLHHTLNLSQAKAPLCVQSLISNGFLSWVLAAKRTHFSDAPLQKAVDCFLRDVISVMVVASGGEVSEDLGRMLELGLQYVEGTSADLLQLIGQPSSNTMVCSEELLAAGRTSALLLVFTVYCVGEQICDSDDVAEALAGFVKYLTPSCSATHPAFKYLLFLHAALSRNCDGEVRGRERVQKCVEDGIAECETPKQWCMCHPLMLDWSFRDENTARLCGRQTLELWLSQDISDWDMDKLGPLQRLGTTNIHCVSTVLELLQSEDDVLEGIAGKWLHCLLSEDQKLCGSSEVQEVIQNQLPVILNRSLMVFKESKSECTDTAVTTMLALFIVLKQKQSFSSPLQEVDLKLAYQVAKLVGNSSADQQGALQWQGMCVLCSLLTQSSLTSDTRVATIVASNKSVLKVVEKGIVQSAEPACLYLLSLLLRQICTHRLQVTEYSLKLDIAQLVHMCLVSNRSDVLNAALGLVFWTTYLGGGHTSGLVCLRQGHSIKGPSDTDIRTLLVLVQQSLLMDDSLVQEMAVYCLQALFLYSDDSPTFLGQLSRQPWHDLILTHVVWQHDPSNPPAWVIRLATLMLTAGVHPLSASVLRYPLEACLKVAATDLRAEHREFLLAICEEMSKDSLGLDPDLLRAVRVKLKGIISAGDSEVMGQGPSILDLLCQRLPLLTTAVTSV